MTEPTGWVTISHDERGEAVAVPLDDEGRFTVELPAEPTDALRP